MLHLTSSGGPPSYSSTSLSLVLLTALAHRGSATIWVPPGTVINMVTSTIPIEVSSIFPLCCDGGSTHLPPLPPVSSRYTPLVSHVPILPPCPLPLALPPYLVLGLQAFRPMGVWAESPPPLPMMHPSSVPDPSFSLLATLPLPPHLLVASAVSSDQP